MGGLQGNDPAREYVREHRREQEEEAQSRAGEGQSKAKQAMKSDQQTSSKKHRK